MKTKPIQWIGRECFCGEARIGYITEGDYVITDSEQYHVFNAVDYSGMSLSSYTEENARFFIEKQFTDFINSISA